VPRRLASCRSLRSSSSGSLIVVRFMVCQHTCPSTDGQAAHRLDRVSRAASSMRMDGIVPAMCADKTPASSTRWFDEHSACPPQCSSEADDPRSGWSLSGVPGRCRSN
jgi:hypothetical protein